MNISLCHVPKSPLISNTSNQYFLGVELVMQIDVGREAYLDIWGGIQPSTCRSLSLPSTVGEFAEEGLGHSGRVPSALLMCSW